MDSKCKTVTINFWCTDLYVQPIQTNQIHMMYSLVEYLKISVSNSLTTLTQNLVNYLTSYASFGEHLTKGLVIMDDNILVIR